MNNVNVDDAFLSLAKSVKTRLIDTQETENDRVRPLQLVSSPVDRLRGACCFGGGGGTSQTTSKSQMKSSKAPNSPHSTKSSSK